MLARQQQRDSAERFALPGEHEARLRRALGDVDGSPVRALREAVLHHRGAFGAQCPGGPHGAGVVRAAQHLSARHDLPAEFDEGLVVRLRRPVVVQVVGLDVGDDGDRRLVFVERALVLVRFHHAGTLAPRRVPAQVDALAAEQVHRVHPRFAQRERHQARCRRLSVRPADRDDPLAGHQPRDHLRAQDDRDAASPCFHQFRIVFVRGCGRDHERSVTDMACVVPFVDTPAGCFNLRGERRRPQVAARDGHALLEQQQPDG
ncbi:MAG: hypothetical protein U5Q44_14715 [Dehalococcoidia bacterium]|nr:hypothetical protein [Dehalococcoidia bacterium]